MKHIKLFALSLFIGIQLHCTARTKVACIGNSITFGYQIAEREENSYPAQLGQMLGDKYQVENFGISARTLMSKGDMPYIKEEIYQKALDYNPEIVVIKLGTNDTKPHNWIHHNDFEADLQRMIDSFNNLESRPKIFLCYPAKVYETTWGINDSTIVNGVIPIIKRVAKRNKLKTINLHKATDNMKEHFKDNVHPDKTGALKIAKTVKKHIK